MATEFFTPGKAFVGKGALEQAAPVLKEMGTHALIVTGKVVTKSGLVDKLTAVLDSIGIKWTVFNDITGEPTDDMVRTGIEVYKKNGCDFGIGIGGGSPLDTVKAILAMTVEKGDITDYNGKVLGGKYPPLAAIPTTAGTGSEATKYTIITDTKKDIKMFISGNVVPELAIVDPSFTYSAPKSVTAATGMDAFTHAVEAYTAKKATPLTDVLALSAVKRIFKYLPVAYKDGTDEKAREELAIGAFEAGICINNSCTTIVHGMSRPIGATFHVPHGISNAMLIKNCLNYVVSGTPERFAVLARIMGVADDSMDDESAAAKFGEGVDILCKACEIPTLKEYGIGEEEYFASIEKMAQDAIENKTHTNARMVVNKDDIIKIYKSLWI